MKNYEELSKLLQFNEKEILYMPNEIFTDLVKCEDIMGSSHIALAYSYIYLTTWLYRYAKYANLETRLEQSKLKEILGYNAKDKKIEYLIKKNGVLEQMKYLETTSDYPVLWEFEDRDLNFDMLSDHKDDEDYYIRHKKLKVKYPLRAVTRYVNDSEMVEEYENGYIDGTFYDVENTHLVPFEVFMYCLKNDDVGLIGFYLWSYIKCKNQIFGDYDASLENLAIDTGIKYRTLNKYLDGLKKYSMIEFTHNQEFFAYGLKKKDRKATTYITQDYDNFTDKPVAYEKMKFMGKKEYDKLLKLEEDEKRLNEEKGRVYIPLEELPY